MVKFSDLPIKQKISRSIFLTSLAALSISSGSIIVYEWRSFRESAAEALNALSDIIGDNAAGAIAFGDSDAANQILLNLKVRESIVAARLYKDNAPFVTYVRAESPGTVIPSFPPADHTELTRDRLKVFHTIRFREDPIGAIYLESDLETVYNRLWHYVGIVLLVLALLIPLVFFIARHLQRIIANPIEDLARLAQEVATNERYSARGRSSGKDEVGRLTETFNLMLEKIERSNEALLDKNKQLVEQSEALQRSNKELEQFAYVSSHDLQEPLRKIITYSQLLESKYKEKIDAEATKFIDNISVCASRMQNLIKDLLAYSRLSRADSDRKQVDLEQVVKGVLGDMESAIKESKATLTNDPLPTVEANSFQMQQLFQNLLANAIKFHAESSPVIHISCVRESDKWLFGVHDNGIGIDPQYFELIFKVFNRLHGRDSYSGTGIGLAICKKIVEQNGGRIWVESEPGAGTHFYFTWAAST